MKKLIEKIKGISKATWLKAAVVVLSVLFLVATAAAVYLGVKSHRNNNQISSLNSAIEENSSLYDSKVSEYESYKSEKESEIASYENQLSAQNSENQSKIDELNKQIDKLNKQLSAKTTTTTEKPTAPSLPEAPLVQHTGAKTVYLTFDDGPSQYTPQILEILDSYGVKATFFVKNGRYNYLMKTIVDKGHQIALHTYSHDYKKIYSSDEAYFADLKQISDVVYQQTGIESKIIRFPGGSSNSISKKYSNGIMTRLTKSVTEKGYVYFDWNCSNGDADGAKTTAKQLEFCRQYPKSASTVVVLMHDTKSATMESLAQIIEYYHSQGMKFGVLTENTPAVHHNVTN